MLINYFKLALKVLNRRKFFTFISLFGISLTLMILMIIAAFLDNELGAHAPVSNIHQLAFIKSVIKSKVQLDTTYTYDTTYVNQTMVLDSTVSTRERRPSVSQSSASFHLLDTYFRDLSHVENYTFYAAIATFDVFVGNKKLPLSGIYTDHQYWQVFDFTFLEGGPYLKASIENQEQVVVISEETRRSYFGSDEEVVGKNIKLETKNYKIVGVVKNVNNSRSFVRSDVYLPYTHARSVLLTDKDVLGSFEGAFLAEKKSHLESIKSEIVSKALRIQLPTNDYNLVEVEPNTYTEGYAQNIHYHEDASKSEWYALLTLGGLLGLFILLPTLNLINVNVTRILERSSEIGVRKSFGATEGNLLFQFVFENIILTFLGGILGFFLAYFMIDLINDTNALFEIKLSFKTSTFFYSFFICLLFGIVSGLIPAWRMSKLNIVTALKQS